MVFAILLMLIFGIFCFIMAFKLKSEQGGWFPNQNSNVTKKNQKPYLPLKSHRKQYQNIIKTSSTTDNMNYDLYKFSAKCIKTNRIHKNKILEAFPFQDVVEIIKSQGYDDPISIEKTEFERPSENQENYYYDLTGKHLPQNASKYDASALISRHTIDEDFGEKDIYSPNPELIEYATQKKNKFSFYIGKKSLYNQIFYNLDIEDKIIFFVFCVYRDKMHRKGVNISGNPYHCDYYYDFLLFAREQLENSSYIKSLSRLKGVDLRYFGNQTMPDGTVINGCSIDTIAYKTTYAFLKEKNLI